MRRLDCLRCGSPMQFLMREKFQKGESGVWVGDLNFHFRGGFEMDVYSCPRCGKIEFFTPGIPEPECEKPDMEPDELPPDAEQNIVSISRDGIPQVQCRACGKRHDFDYPQCPYCDHKD